MMTPRRCCSVRTLVDVFSSFNHYSSSRHLTRPRPTRIVHPRQWNHAIVFYSILFRFPGSYWIESLGRWYTLGSAEGASFERLDPHAVLSPGATAVTGVSSPTASVATPSCGDAAAAADARAAAGDIAVDEGLCAERRGALFRSHTTVALSDNAPPRPGAAARVASTSTPIHRFVLGREIAEDINAPLRAEVVRVTAAAWFSWGV